MSPLTWLPLISRTCRTGAENATAAAAASSQKRAREAATFDTHRAAQIRTQLACLVCLSVTTEVRSVHVTHLKETTREETTCSSCLCQTCLARLDIMRTQTCPYRCSGRILHFTAGVSPQALFLLETERTECSACGDTMLFKDLEAHEAGECPGVLVECSVAGCGVHVPRSSLEMHMHEAKDRHLEVLLRELTATRSRLEQSAEERKRAETQARVWQGRAGQIAASMSARLLNDSAYLARFATDVVPHLLPSRTAALQAGVPPSAAPLVPPACLVGLLACAFEGRLIRAVRATVQYLLFGSRFRDHARLLATVGATGASLGATLAVEVRAQLQRQRQQPQPPPPPRDLLLLLAVLLKAPAPTRRTSMERLTALAREAACFSMVTLCESLGRLELVAQETYLPAAAALSAAEVPSHSRPHPPPSPRPRPHLRPNNRPTGPSAPVARGDA